MEREKLVLKHTSPSHICRRCKRPLRDPKSIAAGMGPVCQQKTELEQEKMPNTENITDKYDPTPLTEGVILTRDASGLTTNVPHLVVHHSPTGYEWGYGGSGAADLAFNIVENALREMSFQGETTDDVWDKSTVFKMSWALRQNFKWDFIGPLHQDYGTQIIPWEDVIEWIKYRIEEKTG